LAVSKHDLLAIFRKLEKSFFEIEPDPSAILFEILNTEPRNCSANRYL
jgi:hypothetical protein